MLRNALLCFLAIFSASFALAQAPANANAALQGEYTFYLIGSVPYAPYLPAGATPAVLAGSFRADGQGHILSGVADGNTGAASLHGTTLTGSYQLDATGKGSVSLVSGSNHFSFSFYAANPRPASLALASITAGFGILEGASGQLAPTPASASPGGTTALLNLTGETGVGAVNDFGTATLTFPAAPGSGSISGQGTEIIDGTNATPFLGVTGTYTTPDPTTGRFTMNLNGFGFGGNAGPETNYIAYQGEFPSGQLIFFSADANPAPLIICVSTNGH